MANIKYYSNGECNKIKKGNYKHGLSGHPLEGTYHAMLSRCLNEKNKKFNDYGGRGITVCEEWRNSFQCYYKWCLDNGWEKGLHIDRTDNDKGYSPENCRIVTSTINGRNKRNNILITYKNQTKALSEWCEVLDLNYRAMLTRIIRHNPTPVELFETPNRYAKHKAKLTNVADGLPPPPDDTKTA